MKILVINKFCPLHPKAGGAEKNLLEVFSRIGEYNEVILISAMYPGAKREERYRNIQIKRIGSPKSENISRIHIRLPLKIAHYVRSIRPDVLFEDVSVVPLFSPIFAPRQKKVIMIHGLNQKYFFSSQRFPLSLIGVLAEWLFLLLYKRERVVVVSEWMRKRLKKNHFRYVHKVLNGVDEHFLAVQKTYTPHPSVLFLGRLEGRKGVDLLLETFPLVRKKIPNVRYCIAGRRFFFNEPLKFSHTLDAYKETYGSRGIEFLGFVTEEKKKELLSSCWVSAVPSRTEGYGISVLEANATGTFVIGNRAEGLSESVIQGRTGALTDCYDKKKFSERIVEWLNLQKLQDHQDICREWARAHSWQNAADEMQKLLLE